MKRSPTTATELFRRRIHTPLEPLDVLRSFRNEPRLVALLGAWHHGEALIAFNPLRELAADPFDGIDLDDRDAHDAFGGGWIGAWGYQLGARIERLPAPPPRANRQHDFSIAFYDYVLRRSNGDWWFEALLSEERSELIMAEHDRVAALLRAPGPAACGYRLGPFVPTPSPAGHRAALATALEHIRAGDIFQANLCIRLEASFAGDPLDVFCRGVAALRPAYSAFLRRADGALASLSPELFLRRIGADLISSPIKGTAALGTDVGELLASGKDRAENVMIVDLMRNDLGRVCEPGSIRVPALNRAERHSVWHLVSDVVGRRRAGMRDSQLLRATFPPGSVTGAPKVRAMEIINALEATARETYTGAIGHISPCAGLELNVAIRTFEFAADRVWLGVGGGIVADSTPAAEYAECLVKARPLIEAIGGRFDPAAEAGTDAGTPAPAAAGTDAAADPDAADPGADRAPTAVRRLESDIDTAQGVFETLLVLDGNAIDVGRHLGRLRASVRAVFSAPLEAGLEEEIARRAGPLVGRHRLRIDAVPQPEGTVSLTFATAPVPAEDASWSLVPRIVPQGLGRHKWIDRRLLTASGPANEELLLCAADGSVLETARANVFTVCDEGVHTPALDGRLLPGTARARVIDVLTAAGIPVFEHRMSVEDLAAAAEVFVTNAVRGIVPITHGQGIGRWPIGPTTSWLAEQGHRPPGGGGSASTLTAKLDAEPPPKGEARVVLIDNYDSFVYNLAQYFEQLGARSTVLRNDAITVDELAAAFDRGSYTHLVVSPGPGTPADAGISCQAIKRLGPRVPTLGVCLGHQCIGEVFGASVVRAATVVHGKPALIHHDGAGVYAGIASPLVAGRYHSLTVDPASVPDELTVTARTPSGVIMGLRHRTLPIEGVQMHPESILTAHGHDMLHNFLRSLD